MEPDIINDTRSENDFRNITFSKFQKSKAKSELINTIYNQKIENACYWCAEFACAGHFLELWDLIIYYYCKYVHIGNPKLPIYLSMRYDNFVSIINNGYAANLLILRNNHKVRKLFAEIICILCYCTKKNICQDVKLNKNEEFDLTNISNKFKAPNIHFCDNIFKSDDPKELFIPLNELIYNLEYCNIIECCYWYEWIIEYENICNKKKKKCICEARIYAPNKFQHDIIWLIWDVIFYYSDPELVKIVDQNTNLNANANNIHNIHNILKTKNINIIHKIIKSLYTLFSIKYKSTSKRKRKYIIYLCFSLLIENINLNSPLINKSSEIDAIIQKIDSIYKDIKKNEISPNTDYLFKNVKKSNIEKTIEKIELMDKF